jgi:hypothetical protein
MHVLKLIVPEAGRAFESESKAYAVYNTYADKVGFNIRKSTTKRRTLDGTISQKYIVCSSEGHQQNASSSGTTRTGWKARVQFSVSKEGIWTVQKIELDHNHYLASPDKSKKMRSQWRVTEANRKLIGQYSRMYCNNEIGCEHNKYLESNDAQTLCNYFKNKQLEDPIFFMQLILMNHLVV